jgi:hypothetical protein
MTLRQRVLSPNGAEVSSQGREPLGKIFFEIQSPDGAKVWSRG